MPAVEKCPHCGMAMSDQEKHKCGMMRKCPTCGDLVCPGMEHPEDEMMSMDEDYEEKE